MPRPARTIFVFSLALITVVGLFLATRTALAQTTFSLESIGSRLGLGNADLVKTILAIIRWFLGFVTLAAVAYMIYGGYLWLTAAGNEQRVEKAKQTILQAAIGLVIILLAWAIVLFVTRTISGAGNGGGPGGGGPGGCNPLVEECTPPTTLDLTAITTCAARPNYSQAVPLSSAVALTFNTSVRAETVQTAVTDATAAPNLEIRKCTDAACSAFASEPGSWPTDPYGKIRPQVYSGTSPTGAAGATKAEWVARLNTITFYHQSFSTDTNNPDNRFFEPNTTYRVSIPKKGATTALRDIRDRALEFCRRQVGVPIEGDDLFNPNCRVDDTTNTIEWTFTTGQDADGPALSVNRTVPTSQYLAAGSSTTPDRNVPRNAAIGIDFTNAIDPNSISPDNFRVYQFTTPPNPTNGQGGVTNPTPLAASDFAMLVNNTGTGAWLQLANGKLFEPFSWYKVEVKDVRNLCGTVQQPNPYSWVFETNDVTPGVKQVYPSNAFDRACPSTEVFIKYKTSMWRVDSGSFDCQVGAPGTYVTTGAMSPSAARSLRVVDQYNPTNPNASCTKYAFTPTSAGLQPGTTYHLGVNSDLTIDINGTKLNYGDIPPAASPSQGPWSFTVTDPTRCVQPPYIDHIAPGQGPAGQCISVVGNYFEKQIGPAARETDGQNAGETTKLATVDQGRADAWTNTTIVTTVNAGSGAGALATDQSHPYTVTVNYPAPIGPLTTPEESWRLTSDSGSQGPCLVSLSKTQGPEGTNLSASGKRFGSTAGRVEFTGPPITWASSQWADTSVGSITVSSGSGLGSGDVQVIDSGGRSSNPLTFTVTPPPPGAGPQVEESTICDATSGTIPSPNPKKNETQACINAWPSARFVGDMDVSTLTTGAGGNISLEQCDSAYTSCTTVATTIAAASRSFQLRPAQNLAADTSFRVTIGTGVKNATDVAFSVPYVWKFKTKAGTAECPIASVIIDQTNQTFNTDFNLYLPSRVIDSACNTVSGSGLSYTWANSEPRVCALLANYTGPTNICTGPADSSFQGTTGLSVKTEGKTSNTVKITYNPTYCRTDSDCAQNRFGEACPGSTCVDNSCTPVVNGLTPDNGKIGTWVTFKGCWFGTYQSGTSKVLFTDNKEGLPPNPVICGSAAATWTNERITREVPNIGTPSDVTDDAIDGPTSVVRFDSRRAAGPNFDVNSEEYPGLCKVTPDRAGRGAAFSLAGQNFGLTRDTPAQDKVSLTAIADGTSADAQTYSAWGDTAIATAVPDTAAYGSSEVRVFNNGRSSNAWPFTVLTPGQTGTACPTTPVDLRCSFADSDVCPGDPTQACGWQNCCQPKPKIIPPTRPAQNEQNVCRNTQVQIIFDQPLNGPSVNTGTVTYTNGGTAVNGKIGLQNTATTGTITYDPGLLAANADQRLTLQPPIRSTSGAIADLTGSPLNFKTGPDICALSRVSVRPPSHTFFTANEPFFPYTAEAWPSTSTTPLAQIDGVYTWDWSWLIGDGSVADVTNNNPNASISQQTVQSKNKAGSTYAQATAQVTFNQVHPTFLPKKSGQATVVVDLCENPWTFADAVGNCTVGGANPCPSFNFNLAYCRGQGSTNLLPDFSYRAIEGTAAADPAPLKSFFFKQGADTRDAIGMLIFNNPDFLSPVDWYNQRFPLDTGGSSTTIGGYPALRTGTTTYIGVTNFTGSALQGVMIVLDYNSNSASSATKNIYNQLLSKITFNTNMNGDDAQRVRRDTKRKQDIASISLLAEAYKSKQGVYPDLAAGSYIVGMSTSVWPSWENTLGNTLGRVVPQDPLNDLRPQCTAPYESSTCWAESTKTFRCPTDAHLYLYTSDGTDYSLYGRMEYDGPGGFSSGNYNPCTSPSMCSCFNYLLSTKLGIIRPPARRL